MSKRRNLEKKIFERLTIIEYSHTFSGKAMWKCECRCGKIITVQANNLLNGHTRSCGCLRKYSPGHEANHQPTKLYKVWSQMKDRCKNANNPKYKYYGAIGISVCAEWFDFITFHKWAMGNGYKEGLTIDRIYPDGNYESKNCRWVPRSIQALNRRPKKGEGIYWETRKQRWRTRITVRGKALTKYFRNYKDAVLFIDVKRQELFTQTIKLIMEVQNG